MALPEPIAPLDTKSGAEVEKNLRQFSLTAEQQERFRFTKRFLAESD